MTSTELFNQISDITTQMSSLSKKRTELTKEYFDQCIREAGFEGRSVCMKRTGSIGELKTVIVGGEYTIRFYPYTKKGTLSQKAHFVWTSFMYQCTLGELKNEFETVPGTQYIP